MGKYLSNSTINGKVSLWLGDISRLEIDAVVNSAIAMQVSSTHGPPRTVHKSLHEAAGPLLGKECRQLQGCLPGDAKVTFGYNLPAKCKSRHIIFDACCIAGNFGEVFSLAIW